MPRARNLKPAFFENEHIGSLSGDIQILFIGLWTQADREGVLECRLGKLKKALFGFREDITEEIFNRYLTVLERLDNGSMLLRVNYNNCDYLIIRNFTDHQTPHHTEKKGKLPLKEVLLVHHFENLTVTQRLEHGENPCQNALNPESRILIPDLLNPESDEVLGNVDKSVDNFKDKKDFLKNSLGLDFDVRLYVVPELELYAQEIARLVKISYEELINRFNELVKGDPPKFPNKAFKAWLDSYTKPILRKRYGS